MDTIRGFEYPNVTEEINETLDIGQPEHALLHRHHPRKVYPPDQEKFPSSETANSQPNRS